MPAAHVHADAPPDVVCDPEGLQYKTGPQLGKGGFAICHPAKLLGHEHLGNTTVALKIVRSKIEPPRLAQKFVTELQIHSKLSHPNIVEFYRAFSFFSSTYIVLELCENGSLADALKKRRYFTMPEIRRFIIQTCGAVKYLHQRSIVHRDLKTGNVFLDGNMNVKVGDFGLAALLISQSDYGAIRRTTMCGTANYLAPEVLEKTGKGHNEKVDLWAIGIIMYTLAVGKPPFYAAKPEEIYRKLRARVYTWPDLANIFNEITDDLRDIVSLLLVHEDERPTPDQIVAHPFFKLGYIPLHLDNSATSCVPKWTKIRPPDTATIKRGYTEEWWAMCKASAVGEYEPGKSFGAYGSRQNKTVARDCQKEIESNKQPNIPFTKDVVYLPFHARVQWPFLAAVELNDGAEKEPSPKGQGLLETTGNGQKGRLPHTVRREEPSLTSKENRVPPPELMVMGKLVDKQPTRIRAVRKISNPERVTAALAPAAVPLRVSKEAGSSQHNRSIRQRAKELSQPLLDHPPLRVSKSSSRPVQRAEPSGLKRVASQSSTGKSALLLRVLSPELPGTDPAATLARLITFRDNLTRALERKRCYSRRDKTPQLPFVSKWVDYSRKYGVGYVLDDGSVGCLMTAVEYFPVTVAFATNGVHHLKELSRNPAYAKEIPIQLYAAPRKTEGISRIEITDARRREVARNYWRKFAKCMCMHVGEEEMQRMDIDQPNFVRFYQRLGTLGIWGFGDGSFQFNFPDHTKLVLSSDAGYGKFMCLPPKAQQILKETGDVAWHHVRARQTLHGSLQQLMYGSINREDSYKELTESNLLRTKLEFILGVFTEWIDGGGIGCLAKPTDWEWAGPKLVSDCKKFDWSSVGRYGGDIL